MIVHFFSEEATNSAILSSMKSIDTFILKYDEKQFLDALKSLRWAGLNFDEKLPSKYLLLMAVGCLGGWIVLPW